MTATNRAKWSAALMVFGSVAMLISGIAMWPSKRDQLALWR